MSALVGAGVVLLAGVLSAQQIANRFVSVRVLDVPALTTQAATWPPSAEILFFADFTINNGTCGQDTDVYVVPPGKWLVLQGIYGVQIKYILPGNTLTKVVPPVFHWSTGSSAAQLVTGSGPYGLPFPSGTRLMITPTGSTCSAPCHAFGYTVDA